MSKRQQEPDEAIGPALNGLDYILPAMEKAEEEKEEEILPEEPVEEIEPEFIEHPVALICGIDQTAQELINLAAMCGFTVELAVAEQSEADLLDYPQVSKIHVVPHFESFVEICDVTRDYFICVFVDDIDDCEFILSQCLASDAYYLGAAAEGAAKAEIFAKLRQDGAPDAELAAICCPMGLSIGASTPSQKAVAIMAELLAARAGVIKRLR